MKKVISLILLLALFTHLFTYVCASEEPMTLDDNFYQKSGGRNANDKTLYTPVSQRQRHLKGEHCYEKKN